MKIGIMQPYFFPYIGYFQLLNMVDKYVVYDTGKFSNNKWGFRNRILINGAPGFFRVKTLKASQDKAFNEIRISNDFDVKKKNIHTLECAYKKAPYYSKVMPMLEQFLMGDYDNLSECNVASIRLICNYLGINTEILLYSEMGHESAFRKQYRIFDICRLFGSKEYINAIGGMELYDFEEFRENGIELAFLKSDEITYPQFGGEFVPNLSIIDVMMFNSVPEIQDFLNQYTLIRS